MIITCDKCRTRYRVKPELLKKAILKVKCSHCQHIFMVETNKQAPVQLHKKDIVSHAKIITICNQKGGVAKTSTCINLGAALAEQNKRVLLVDFDVLANLTLSLGYDKDASFYQLVQTGDKNIASVIKQFNKNLSLLPSNNDMNLFPKYYMHKKGFELLLKNQLKKISRNYDYILIDTPPSMEFFTLNALMAAELVLIPTQCEFFSMNGVSEVEKIITLMEEKYKYKLPYHVLINMFDPSNTAAKVIFNQLNKQFSDKILKTIIETDTKVQEAQIMHQPVIYYADNSSKAVQQYTDLAQEIASL